MAIGRAGVGVAGYVGLAFQGSGGYANVQATSVHWMPMISESIKANNEVMRSGTMRASYEETEPEFGLRSVGGDVVMEVDAVTVGALLKAAMGACATAITSATGIRTHLFKAVNSATLFSPWTPMQPFTLFIGRDVGSQFVYHDCIANTLELSFANGEFNKATMGVLGLGGIMVASEMAPVYPLESAVPKQSWIANSVAYNGAAANFVQNMTFKLDNKIEVRPTLTSSNNALRMKRAGFREIRISGNLEFEDATEAQKWESGSAQMLELQARANAAGNQTLQLRAYRMKYDDFTANIGGPGAITAAFEASAVYNTSSGAALTALVTVYSSAGVGSGTGTPTGWATYGDGAIS